MNDWVSSIEIHMCDWDSGIQINTGDWVSRMYPLSPRGAGAPGGRGARVSGETKDASESEPLTGSRLKATMLFEFSDITWRVQGLAPAVYKFWYIILHKCWHIILYKC